jgi:dolichol kinase
MAAASQDGDLLPHDSIIRDVWENSPVAIDFSYDRRTRKTLHLLLGFPALLLPFVSYKYAIAVVVLGVLFTFWLRADRFNFISRLAKPSDHRINSVTGFQVYAIVVLILVSLVPALNHFELPGERYAMLGWLVMSWGDGLSGLLGPGPKVARTVPWNSEKTWLGSLGALIGSCLAACVCYLVPLTILQNPPLPQAMMSIAIVSMSAAALESLQLRIDDNFTVGIGSVLTALLIASAY